MLPPLWPVSLNFSGTLPPSGLEQNYPSLVIKSLQQQVRLAGCLIQWYLLAENMPELQRIVRLAMDDWESKTCLKFVPRKDESETDYVTFFRGTQ